jgi:hypothetical protein
MTDNNELSVASSTPSLPAVPTFESTAVGEYGNKVARALLLQFAYDEDLAERTAAAEESRGLIGFELTKAVMNLQQENEKVNIYAIWEGGKAVEKLNTRLLVAMGVMSRIADEESDSVIYKWSDAENEKAYNYSAVDKEKDKDEYQRRFNNRKRLNIALSNACKSAIGLLDEGTKAENLKITQVEGEAPKAVIENPPEAIAGKDKDGNKPTVVEFGKRTIAAGATHSPTMASLIKIATDKHKAAEGESTERSDKGADRSGEAKIAMTDEAFGGIVNNLKRAIVAQEGTFTPDMVKQMQSLIPVLNEAIAAAAQPKAPADDQSEATTAPAKATKKK